MAVSAEAETCTTTTTRIRSMNEIFTIIGNPHFWGLIAAYWIFNAAVEAMPEPNGFGPGYHWLYKFLNTLSGNVQEAFKHKIPGAK